jgi:hypothetical protein
MNRKAGTAPFPKKAGFHGNILFHPYDVDVSGFPSSCGGSDYGSVSEEKDGVVSPS